MKSLDLNFHWKDQSITLFVKVNRLSKFLVCFFLLIAFVPSMLAFKLSLPKYLKKLRISPYYGIGSYRSHSRLLMNGLVGASNFESDLDLSKLTTPDSKVHPYWIDQLRRLERPVAKALIPQLIPGNPLGFDPGQGRETLKQGTLLHYTIQQKLQHPNKIILIRSGEFYETYGVDALMLIAYCGLNPMGNKCKAGCPVKNVQATLDGLTSVGLSVAVFEEITEIDTSRTSSGSSLSSSSTKAKIKSRALTQIVSPASSTYVYDLCLRSDDIEFKDNRPAVGILKTAASGYLLCQIYLDEQCMTVSERLTQEAVHSILAHTGAIDPIYIQLEDTSSPSRSVGSSGGGGNDLSFLLNHPTVRMSGYGEKDFPYQVLQKICSLLEIENPLQSFRIFNQVYTTTQRSRPIYTSTALQIGLLPNDNVPNLIPCLLPRSSSSSTSSSSSSSMSSSLGLDGSSSYTSSSSFYSISSKFLRKWIINPPPHHIADAMQSLCLALSNSKESIPPFQPISVGKVTSLLTAKQGNVALFRDILKNTKSLSTLLHHSNLNDNTNDEITVIKQQNKKGKKRLSGVEISDYSSILEPLLTITTYQCGIPAKKDLLLSGCERVTSAIQTVIAEETMFDSFSIDPYQRIPDEFFKRNEEEFRNKIYLYHPDIMKIYSEINESVKELCNIINQEVPRGIEIQHDMMENAIMMKDKPKPIPAPVSAPSLDMAIPSSGIDLTPEEEEEVKEVDAVSIKKKTRRKSRLSIEGEEEVLPSTIAIEGVEYIQYVDRKGKVTARKYTTPNIQRALNQYLQLVELAPLRVSRILQSLSSQLLTDLITIVQASHLAVILQASLLHTTSAMQKGWTMPTLVNFDETEGGGDNPSKTSRKKTPFRVEGLTPYWFSRDKAMKNEIELNGIMLLTAPNMSGKSTLMRSVLVIALLANCGLFIPATSATIPRFDTFFLRTASYDIPSEAKSAFALEMDDMRVILRDCTNQSLIMIDELGKGTSARDGSSLAGALLEYLQEKDVYGIFATHLHELFLLPVSMRNIIYKKMGYQIDSENEGNIQWTYRLEDGVCTDSMALTTARQYGLPNTILSRAKALMDIFDDVCRPSSTSVNTSIAPLPPVRAPVSLSSSDILLTSPIPQGPSNVRTRGKRMNVIQKKDYLRETISPLVVQFLNRFADESAGDVRAEEFSSIFNGDKKVEDEDSDDDTNYDYDGFESRLVFIPHHHNPPPLLESQSVVYILHIYSPSSSIEDIDEVSYYSNHSFLIYD